MKKHQLAEGSQKDKTVFSKTYVQKTLMHFPLGNQPKKNRLGKSRIKLQESFTPHLRTKFGVTLYHISNGVPNNKPQNWGCEGVRNYSWVYHINDNSSFPEYDCIVYLC